MRRLRLVVINGQRVDQGSAKKRGPSARRPSPIETGLCAECTSELADLDFDLGPVDEVELDDDDVPF